VVAVAKEREVPIRIGVNAGSLPANFQPDAPPAERMVNMALEQIKLMESLDFRLIKVSLKAFDVPTTIQAYQMIAGKMPYPLHLGITEAGLPRTGAIRSAIGIGVLLYQGIGDTIRVSLSAHPCEEVFVAYEILKSLGLRQRGPTLVSCPSCGRAEVDIIALAEAVSKRLEKMSQPVKVAVMGCIVNGPGEAKDADVGIACGKGKGAIFKKGEVVSTASEDRLLEALMAELNSLDRIRLE
jgi:(E)-4-hydroxy-3-methylbut-2-enyl-diphosphate synthase